MPFHFSTPNAMFKYNTMKIKISPFIINEEKREKTIEVNMPFVPAEGSILDIFIENSLCSCKVISTSCMFNEKNKYLGVMVYVETEKY